MNEWKYMVTLLWKDPITQQDTGLHKFPICCEYDEIVEEYIKGWQSRHHQGELIHVVVNPVFDKYKIRCKQEYDLCAYAQ